LSERGEFFGLHQAILSGAQVLQGFCQFACSRLYAFEKSRILDRQHRLGGEGLQELDGALGKFTRFLAPDYEGAHDLFCAKKWNVQQGTESGADDNIKRRRRIVLNSLCAADDGIRSGRPPTCGAAAGRAAGSRRAWDVRRVRVPFGARWAGSKASAKAAVIR